MVKREDLASRLSEKGYTKKAAKIILEDVFETIGEFLEAGEDVQLSNFGCFYIHINAPKEGIHPQTGERITIPETVTPKFKASKTLKKKCNTPRPENTEA